MKFVIFLSLFFLSSSCAVRGAWTGTEYSIGANRADGVYIKAMPLKWQEIVNTKEAFVDWVGGVDGKGFPESKNQFGSNTAKATPVGKETDAESERQKEPTKL